MNKDEINAIIKKRNIDLEMLGVAPQLYYTACKYIDRVAKVVVKEGDVYVFSVNGAVKKNTHKNAYITSKQISDNISKVLGINNQLSSLIINEWLRDRVIEYNMGKDINRFWGYLATPSEVVETDEYNF